MQQSKGEKGCLFFNFYFTIFAESKNVDMKTYRLISLLLFATLGTACIQAQPESSGNIFSKSFRKGTPVHITNNRDKGYAIKYDSAEGCDVGSGSASYTKEEIWYLVGDADAFTLHSYSAGKRYAVKLEGNESGSAATMARTGEATILALIPQEDGSYAISPANNRELSFNMFGGAGRDIKLYSSSDNGGHWNITPVDTKKPLTINYIAETEGGLETNTMIGGVTLNINGNSSHVMLRKDNLPESTTCYLPAGARVKVEAGPVYHGWKMEIDRAKGDDGIVTTGKGLETEIHITVDKENRYQYLFYSPSSEGHPYRIPAIVTTANGYVFAINDYRPCGNDIGYGEVDLVMRHSTAAGKDWDGHNWSQPVKIADGVGDKATETWLTGFGDPAVVADRENNEILVMSVCGNRVCWHGNYGAGTPDNPENPNRIARMRIKFNDETGEWEAGAPEEVTYEIYPLFKDSEGNVHSSSMFIGAGRIAQSSKIKVGTHYRIYCAVWTISSTTRQHHNYALYSDDFGESWHVLGEIGYENSPAPRGNEPKCEELPDGSVLLSSRKGYGRYFNVFRYTNIEKGEGRWEGVVSTDVAGNLKWGSNDTNGEPLRIGNVMFQSAPTGNSRSNVSVFYKVLSKDAATYTPEELSKGWTEIKVSDRGSAYSSMCILPDGKSIGLYYEEEPGGYSMVYVPLILEEILPAEVFKELSK